VRLAIVPGSFDPLTNGHVDMIARGVRLFDRLVVAVAANPAKQPWLALDERVALIREVLAETPETRAVDVDAFEGLVADYVRERGALAVIRGLRSVSELSDELQMAMMNRHLFEGFETVFLVSDPRVAHISSRLVREIASFGGSLDGLVPSPVAARLRARRSPDRAVRV
jgi:pantetheine-phosphate adenylyltransferase